MSGKNGRNHCRDNCPNKRRNGHHIYPVSVRPDLAGDPKNKTPVMTKKHDVYHIFYDNDPPERIIEKTLILFPRQIAFMIISYLNKEFWGELFDVDADRDIMAIPLFKIEKKNGHKAMIVVD